MDADAERTGKYLQRVLRLGEVYFRAGITSNVTHPAQMLLQDYPKIFSEFAPALEAD